MNSYFLAILQATDNGTFPELSDCWRSFHESSFYQDSDLFDPSLGQVQFLQPQA
jgi:hypothetical protein